MKKFKTILLLMIATLYNTNIMASYIDDFDTNAYNILHIELDNGMILDRNSQGVRLTGEFVVPGDLVFSLRPELNNGDLIACLTSIGFINSLEVGDELFDAEGY